MKEFSITPLGTVSPYPKNDMNCPSFLIKYNDCNILLDCGNGSTRLLNFEDDLSNLNVIITHYHKDHFGDIGAIQYASYVYHNMGLLDKKVKVYLPYEDFQGSKKFILDNTESFVDYIDIYDNSSVDIENLHITFHDSKSHSIPSFMVKLEDENCKVIYTSDVGVNNFDDIVNFSMNADLLISESSFLLKHNSSCKTHLTAYKAGELAKRSNTKRLLLTHFWPEVNKNEYLEESKKMFENSFVACEGKKLLLKK